MRFWVAPILCNRAITSWDLAGPWEIRCTNTDPGNDFFCACTDSRRKSARVFLAPGAPKQKMVVLRWRRIQCVFLWDFHVACYIWFDTIQNGSLRPEGGRFLEVTFLWYNNRGFHGGRRAKPGPYQKNRAAIAPRPAFLLLPATRITVVAVAHLSRRLSGPYLAQQQQQQRQRGKFLHTQALTMFGCGSRNHLSSSDDG